MILRLGVHDYDRTAITFIDGVICNVKVKPRCNDKDAGYSENDGLVILLLAFLRLRGSGSARQLNAETQGRRQRRYGCVSGFRTCCGE
jgi:hypothetical protein